ncbi:tannase/feruloyl esterase family alpha/beta hydrolase [soil metagenome]
MVRSKGAVLALVSIAGLAVAGLTGRATTAAPVVKTPVAAAPVKPSSMAGCDDAAFGDVPLQDAKVRSVTMIKPGPYTTTRAPSVIDDMPAFCRVLATATPTKDSSIDFEVWLPLHSVWNGKLVSTGNGGYSTVPSYTDMAYALKQGYAVVGGDTGHVEDDMLWGVGHPEKIFDWSSRSVHAITVAGKKIVSALNAREPERAYYYGCSTGGQQGFAQVQRYPNDFDGVIAGAPAYDRTALHAEFLWRFLSNRNAYDPVTRILKPEKASMVYTAAVAACDALDGVRDGVISDPRECTRERFDPRSLLCTGAETDSCLTPPQIVTLDKIYSGATNPRTGAQIYPGLAVGSEASWGAVLGDNVMPPRIDFWRLWAREDKPGDNSWDWWRFDFDKDLIPGFTKIAPLIDQTSVKLDPFKSRGSKLIVFHGWGDSSVSPKASIAYFDKLRAAQGSQSAVDSFARLFLVPGMGHCGGGPGATSFGNAGNAPVTMDADHDLLHAMDRWITQGKAPDRIVAAHIVDEQATFTRPLCPYPKKSVYDGKGDPKKASSFDCR